MIRFACPGCKSVLAGGDEQAGKIVTCPKCGQRMQAPRPSQMTRKKSVRRSRRSPIAGIAVIGGLLLAMASGGIWLWTYISSREPELSADRLGAATVRERRTEPLPNGRGSESGAATVRERPSQPSPDDRSSNDLPRQSNKSPAEKSPTLPPAANAPGSSREEKKEIDLANDLPPELPFDLVDAINDQRAKAGVEPIFLDPELSRPCQSRAEQLARHATSSGSAVERGNQSSAENETVAEAAPLTAIDKWLKEPKRRTAILEPRLRTFGAGFARNVEGQWFSVFDWTGGLDREPPLQTTPITGAIVYPAPGQTRISLWYPGNETPDPLPQTKDKLAGYPITLIFPPQTRIEKAAARLRDKKDDDIPLWLSSPEKPANPRFAGSQQNTICLIAKKPLHPNTRYRVEVSATVNGTAWSAKWEFITTSEGAIHQEIAGSFLRMLNRLRRRAGLPPVPLHAERSKGCAAHAHYLGRNVPNTPALNWNEEKADLPGHTAEGAAMARTASIQGGGGPIEAVNGLIDSLISRPLLLDPRLREVGLGYAPFVQGGWLWVIDLHRAGASEAGKEFFYPAPDQENVPLVYPPNEVPSPIPAGEARAAERPDVRSHAERGNEGNAEIRSERRMVGEKTPRSHAPRGNVAGYAITVLFGPRSQVTAATAKLMDDKGIELAGWLSTPEKPAIAGFPQHSLCFLPKAPLRPGTRYTAMFRAEVNGRQWRRTWSFTTQKEPDRYADNLDDKIVAQLNAARKSAGLPPVRLDAELSRGCQAHASYLGLNHRRSAILGMDVHRQNANLPGASPEGARAAKESVIAVVLDPQTCVENWMATLYHRIPMLAPNLERVGFAHARIQGHKWVCVLDTGNGRRPRGREKR